MVDPDLLQNIADYARTARSKLSKDVCDYFEGGARGKSMKEEG